MKRLLRWSAPPLPLLGAMIFLMSGCTLDVPFTLVNETAEPVEVSYRVRLRGDRPEGGFPAGRVENEWETLPPGQYRFDRGTRTITLTLAPGQEVRLVAGDGFTGDPRRAGEFPVEEMLLTGAGGGERVFRGAADVRGQFAGRRAVPFFTDPSSYVMIYK